MVFLLRRCCLIATKKPIKSLGLDCQIFVRIQSSKLMADKIDLGLVDSNFTKLGFVAKILVIDEVSYYFKKTVSFSGLLGLLE